jgi:integrase/recombinase XerC
MSYLNKVNSKLILSQLPRLNQLPNLLSQYPFNQTNLKNNDVHESMLICIENDYEAIFNWLLQFESNHSTFRAYRLEAERFLLWCYVNQLPLGSIDKERLDVYCDFLKEPTPKALWCLTNSSGHKPNRNSPHWKPFQRGLSAKSLKHHWIIISSLFNFLVNAGYLKKNPFKLTSTLKSFDIRKHQYKVYQRIPTPLEWSLIINKLKSWPDEIEKIRLRFIISMLFYTGMRISELANLCWSSFHKTPGGWSIFIVGKGNKPREIVVEDLMFEVIAYRSAIGLSYFPSPDEMNFVVNNLQGNKAIGVRQLFNLIKKLAKKASEASELSLEVKNRLKAFSPHWIRHLCPTIMVKHGVDKQVIQEHLGHSNSQTTDIYIHLFNQEKREAVRKLKLGL